ncbi:MAG TPA: multiubiquitin domain-containing protein [Rhodothermales bacterium]
MRIGSDSNATIGLVCDDRHLPKVGLSRWTAVGVQHDESKHPALALSNPVRSCHISGMPSSSTNEHISIVVDGVPFRVESTTMSGSQIKALAGKDVQYGLFLEAGEREADRAVPDGSSVRLEPGMQFYTVPAAVFGQ